MRRKSLWLAIGMLLLAGGGVLGTLAALTRHEPAFYGRSAIPPGVQREALSGKFVTQFIAFQDAIKYGGDPQNGMWRGRFSEAEINSFFQDDFVNSGLAEKLLPEGISDPRVALEGDRLRLGFRYDLGIWNTVIAVEFRVWLAKAEPNVVVLELRSLHAGALPISAQSLLEEISESLRRHSIQVTWYRHEGNPTAALKFQTDQPRPTAQLRQLELKTGALTIVGKSSEPLPTRPPAPPR